MIIRSSPRLRAALWMTLRLALFAGIFWLAVDFLLLRQTREKEFDRVEDTGLLIWFIADGTAIETRKILVLGKTLFETTKERQVVTRGSGIRRSAWQFAIWKPHDDDGVFYPATTAAVSSIEMSNSIIYKVMPPTEPGSWKFKVTHRASRTVTLGPFTLKGAPIYTIYSSPVMTNTLSPPNPPSEKANNTIF